MTKKQTKAGHNLKRTAKVSRVSVIILFSGSQWRSRFVLAMLVKLSGYKDSTLQSAYIGEVAVPSDLASTVIMWLWCHFNIDLIFSAILLVNSSLMCDFDF